MAEADVLRELRKISKILLLVNAATVEKELAKVATSDERKRMWVLIDGRRMPKDIANAIGVTPMAVSYFLNAALAAELIEYKPREPPRRLLDYVPPNWIALVSLGQATAAVAAAPQESHAMLDTVAGTRESEARIANG